MTFQVFHDLYEPCIQAKLHHLNGTISLIKHPLTQLQQCWHSTMLTLTLWSLLMSPSLYSLLPSIMPDKGLENHSLKSLCDWKTCGIKKCINDQSSIKLFWKGVPVRRSLQWLLKFRRYCHLCDLKFLMFWAYRRIDNHLYASKWKEEISKQQYFRLFFIMQVLEKKKCAICDVTIGWQVINIWKAACKNIPLIFC